MNNLKVTSQNKFLSRKFLIILICVLFIALFAFLITNSYLNLNRDEKIHTADMKDMIDQRTSLLLFEINIFPQDIGDDLLFLSELSILKSSMIKYPFWSLVTYPKLCTKGTCWSISGLAVISYSSPGVN